MPVARVPVARVTAGRVTPGRVTPGRVVAVALVTPDAPVAPGRLLAVLRIRPCRPGPFAGPGRPGLATGTVLPRRRAGPAGRAPAAVSVVLALRRGVPRPGH